MDKLDFKHFDEKFNNVPQKVGEELSEIDRKRDAWIAENALTYKLEPAVPDHIEGSRSSFRSRETQRQKAPSDQTIMAESHLFREKRLLQPPHQPPEHQADLLAFLLLHYLGFHQPRDKWNLDRRKQK